MAAMNSSVLACNHEIMSSNHLIAPPMPYSVAASPVAPAGLKLLVIRAQAQQQPKSNVEGRRVALLGIGIAAAALLATTSSPSAKAGVIEDYLERSKANKELNDKKRLATSGANFARAYTVEFGSCKFPENFTGCQDLAKQKKVKFLSEDLELECQGKDKYKCGSNVFWKW
ncbi:hypothetical protein NMG60_11007053 [Bertholletia excelsa]